MIKSAPESAKRWALIQITELYGEMPYFAPDAEKVNYSSFLFASPRDAKMAALNILKDEVDAHLRNPDDYEDDVLPEGCAIIIPVELWENNTITSEIFDWQVEIIYGFFGMDVPN